MIASLLTITVVALLLVASQVWWRSNLNPVTFGLLAWTPGLIMMHWPPFFLSPLYIHLNRPIYPMIYLALGLSLASFWMGCALVRALSPSNAFVRDRDKLAWRASAPRLAAIYIIGLAIFLYAYFNSGLLDMQNLDAVGVAESRIRLHFGWASFFILFMDIAAIMFFSRLLQTGRWFYAAPMVIALLCQGATLQKSRFLFLLIGCIFLACLSPKETYRIFLKTLPQRLTVLLLAVLAFAALFGMNAARGIAVVQMTSASSPLLEQVYIYSSASAIQNVSVTLEGYMPSDEPRLGLYMARPILWHFVDKEQFFATRYFEGVNAATYLIYGWADFRWLGFFIFPFAVGIVCMLCLRAALGGSLIGIMLGVLQMQAVVYSSATDVLFDPTATVVIALSIMAWLLTDFHARSRTSKVTARAPDGLRVPDRSRNSPEAAG